MHEGCVSDLPTWKGHIGRTGWASIEDTRLYERQGYVRTGEVEPFPRDDPTVGKPLRDDLALVILRKELNRR